MSAGRIAVDGGELAWEEAGAGPPLVLLHGFGLDRRMWAPQAATLEGRFRVVRYDLRGFGKSSVPAGPYDHAADLARLLDTLEVEAPLVAGLSLGANVAMSFAASHPGRARGLVLASPGLPGHPWTEERPPEAARRHAQAHGVAAGKRFWRDHALFASLDRVPEARRAVDAMLDEYGGWHWRNADPQVAPGDLAERLAGVETETLVLSGDLDVAGYREIAARIAQIMPAARLERLAGAGHMLNLEAPARFEELVSGFAARIGAGETRREAPR